MNKIYPDSVLRPWFLFVPLPFSLLLFPAILLLWLACATIAGAILWYGVRLNFGHVMGYIIMNAIILAGMWLIGKRFEDENEEDWGYNRPLIRYALFGSFYFWREVIEIIWLFLFVDFWWSMKDNFLGPVKLPSTN